MRIAALHLVVGTAFGVFFIRSVPKYELIYRDFDLPLPGATLIVLRLSHGIIQ